MEEAVEHGGDGSGIAQHLAPVFARAIRGEERAGAFVVTPPKRGGRAPAGLPGVDGAPPLSARVAM